MRAYLFFTQGLYKHRNHIHASCLERVGLVKNGAIRVRNPVNVFHIDTAIGGGNSLGLVELAACGQNLAVLFADRHLVIGNFRMRLCTEQVRVDKGEMPPDRFMRPEISKTLLDLKSRGELFI